MSTKRKSYSADFKAKLVLEALEGERTINEIASAYGIIPKNLINWKKQFLDNMSLAFDKSTVVKVVCLFGHRMNLGLFKTMNSQRLF